jgi:hypothetical protein
MTSELITPDGKTMESEGACTARACTHELALTLPQPRTAR